MQDDDSILDKLLNELDIESAIYRLQKIGFSLVSAPDTQKKYHHLTRSRGGGLEDMFIETNSDNHFVIKYACEGLMALYPDTITTWDEWVAFVRLLGVKHVVQKRKPEDLCKDDDMDAKRLKCTEQ